MKVARLLVRFIKLYLISFSVHDSVEKIVIRMGETQEIKRISQLDHLSIAFNLAIDKFPRQIFKALEKTSNSLFYNLFFFYVIGDPLPRTKRAALGNFSPNAPPRKSRLFVYKQCLLNIEQLKYTKRIPSRQKYISHLVNTIKIEARFFFYELALQSGNIEAGVRP